ncbi:hypothetical protein JQN58_15545 [Aneurinibacillus sp. BA2021]|nr:hypothetical protein [Aneurinibacillus sp. BA2021]
MNIFQYQGQEEDHYTNVLMNILSLNNYKLIKPFLGLILGEKTSDFTFENLHISMRTKYCPQEIKEYEYIIGIAPYQKYINERNQYQNNLSSIPDAWICGSNFNLLFEFKIRGILDEGQITAHKNLLGHNCGIVRLEWIDIITALEKVNANNRDIEKFLIEQFLEVSSNFKSKRIASGMPKEIISHVKKDNELHFIITGSKKTGTYTVEMEENYSKVMLNQELSGIQSARSWIAKYVFENKDNLNINYEGMNTIISDYCVAPNRDEKKNQWNQWRIGSFLNS